MIQPDDRKFLADQIARLSKQVATIKAEQVEFMPIEQVLIALGFQTTKELYAFCRDHKIPHFDMSKRRKSFRRADIEKHLSEFARYQD